jgi:hypothetical protein
VFSLNKEYSISLFSILRPILLFLTFFNLSEITITFFISYSLTKFLLEKKYKEVNNIIHNLKKKCQKYSILYFFAIIIFSLFLWCCSLYNNIHNEISDYYFIRELSFWKILFLLLSIGSKELITFYFVGAYQILIENDKSNFFWKLVIIFSDLLNFAFFLIALLFQLPVYLIFFGNFFSGIIRVFLVKTFVNLKYLWLNEKHYNSPLEVNIWSKKLVFEYNKNFYLNFLLNNVDLIFILFTSNFWVTSIYSTYLIYFLAFRSFGLIFLNIGRNFFIKNSILKNQNDLNFLKVNQNLYFKLQLYSCFLAVFFFSLQLLFIPFLFDSIFKEQFYDDYMNNDVKIFHNWNWIIFFLSLFSAFHLIIEPIKLYFESEFNFNKLSKFLFFKFISFLFLIIILFFFRFLNIFSVIKLIFIFFSVSLFIWFFHIFLLFRSLRRENWINFSLWKENKSKKYILLLLLLFSSFFNFFLIFIGENIFSYIFNSLILIIFFSLFFLFVWKIRKSNKLLLKLKKTTIEKYELLIFYLNRDINLIFWSDFDTDISSMSKLNFKFFQKNIKKVSFYNYQKIYPEKNEKEIYILYAYE